MASIGSRYRLETQLHSGIHSTVWLATQVSLSRQVVVKFFHCDEADARSTLSRELSSLCQLRHPNNVSVLDTGPADGEQGDPYVVLEYVPGTTLRHELKVRRRLEPMRVWRLGLQLLGALTEAHSLGIVHRDVKPENLMLWQPPGLQEHVKVIDYGMSRSIARATGSFSTLDGLAAGTPHYMAPEVALGKRASPASDLYALGVVMYEALAGQRPFDGQEPVAVLYQTVHQQPPNLRDLVPVPEELAAIVHRAIAKKPEDRFTSAEQMQEALRALTWRNLMRYRLGAFSPTDAEEELDTDVFQPSAWEAASGVVGEPTDLPSDLYAPVHAEALTDLALRSPERPSIWVLTDDPGTRGAELSDALLRESDRFDVRSLDAPARKAVLADLMAGNVRAPWVLIFGDMHVLLQDPLVQALRGHAETSRLLVSTHLNAEMLQATVNFSGLDHQISLPVEPEDLRAGLYRMVERSRALHQATDQLRIAVRDARGDLERRLRATSQTRSTSKTANAEVIA